MMAFEFIERGVFEEKKKKRKEEQKEQNKTK